MNFADLTDTDFTFQCEFSGDACEYWDYDFSIKHLDDRYSKNLSRSEIEQLRDNCQKILKATEGVQGVY